MKGEADVNMTDNAVEIGAYFEQFISRQVASGRFTSDMEVLQAGLRLLEEQELRFRLEKSKLAGSSMDESGMNESEKEASEVSRSVTEAMRALASVAGEPGHVLPAIPVTKGLLRSQIAAE
nr:type II toxin-antitoxin system ParD family antitoxin [uncultured Cohaesibacter sp.]